MVPGPEQTRGAVKQLQANQQQGAGVLPPADEPLPIPSAGELPSASAQLGVHATPAGAGDGNDDGQSIDDGVVGNRINAAGAASNTERSKLESSRRSKDTPPTTRTKSAKSQQLASDQARPSRHYDPEGI
jgi:hypothetical protein